ncbi:MAG: WD40 repeat domain-containing protein [Brevinematia bacterium]
MMRILNLFFVILLIFLLYRCAPQKEEKFTKHEEAIQIVEKTSKTEIIDLSISPLNTIQGHYGYIYYFDISPDGKTMVSGGSDKNIKLWDISNLPEIKEIKSIKRLYSQLWGPPVKFSEDGNYIFSGSYDFIEVFDKNLNYIANLRISDKGIQSIEVEDNKIFASDVNGFVYKISFDGKKLNLEDKKQIHNEEIWKIKASEDGKYIITASVDKTSKVLDTKSLNEIATLRAHAGPLEFVSVSKDKIALFSADSHISIWDYNFNLLGKIYDSDKKDIIVGKFSKSGKYIISGGKSYKIKIWNVENMQLEKTLEWHKNDIMAIILSIDNKYIISGDRDGKIAIWRF